MKILKSKDNDIYVHVKMNTLNGVQKVDYHGYLYGLIEGIKYLVSKKYHGFIIMTGKVGSGKSSLMKGIAALWEQMHGRDFQVDQIVWVTEKFISKTEQDNNFGEVLPWDEAITGATGRKMGNTSQGDELKTALVTKRFKRHLYILLVDEIEEYSWKLIKMAQAWIDVRTFGDQRGYFDCYTKTSKIKSIYLGLKERKKKPDFIKPDGRGKFRDYTGLFLDEKEYDKKKLEQTNRDSNATKSLTPKQIMIVSDVFRYLTGKREQESFLKEFGYNRKDISRLHERLGNSENVT